MAKTRKQKEEIVASLKERFHRARSVVVARYGAMTVAQSQALRLKLHERDAEYVAVKKTLLDAAMDNREALGIQPRAWEGSIGLLFGYGDEAAPAKALADFAKGNEGVIQALGGIFERQWIDAVQVEALSVLPTKLELRGQLVGLLNAPISGVVHALTANLRQLVSAIDAIGKAKT